MSINSLIGTPNFDQLEIVKTGVTATPAITATNFTTNTYTASDTILVAHNLGFAPIALGAIQDSTNNYFHPLPYTDPEAGGTGGGIQITVFYLAADSQYLYVTARTVAYGPYYVSNYNVASLTVKYYLFRSIAKS